MNGFNPLYLSDGYKIGHKAMLAKDTQYLYGTWIPRAIKYAPEGVTKIVSFGQQLIIKWLHEQFEQNFFNKPWGELSDFVSDMSEYLGLDYDGAHFEKLHNLGYLPIKIKSLEEGVETVPNIPHMTFINTHQGFAWLTLYLETIISSMAWKPSTSATIALQYRRNAIKWVQSTDLGNLPLVPYMCHDFSARGLSPWDMITSGLGHATSFRGSDTLALIPAARYYYNEKDVIINSVNASEHSVSTTKIFTVGEKQMILDWIKIFPKGILSLVADTFDLWEFITEFLVENKEAIMARDGKIVIRPDSGDPVDIICGKEVYGLDPTSDRKLCGEHERKGVIELLWDIFGGTINQQGYKVLDPHIGAIYGDSITLDRQVQIYKRLAEKGFATTNIILGIGSFTYQYNTRDTFSFAAKGSAFAVSNVDDNELKWFSIYKDPITDDGTKKSLRGFQKVYIDDDKQFAVLSDCTLEEENSGELRTIYYNGMLPNQTTFSEIRNTLENGIHKV